MSGHSTFLTFFACPKPFKGHDAVIQTNALRNWKSLGIDIILLGDDPGVAEAAAIHDCVHIPEILKTRYGTPLLSDSFAKAQAAAKTPLICYSNADILYPPSLLKAAISVQQQLSRPFLLVGQRWDVDVDRYMDESDFTERGMAALRGRGKLHLPWGIDYFLFPCGSISLPPFAIGRPGWDNWMIWDARRRGVCVIDSTDAIAIIHQNHGYSHVPGRVALNWMGSPEADYNQRILRKISSVVRWGEVTVCDAKKRLTSDFTLQMNLSAKRMAWLFSVHRQRVKMWIWNRLALAKKIWGSERTGF